VCRSKIAKQRCRGLGDTGIFRIIDERAGVGLQRLPDWPASHVLRVADGRGIHQGQGGLQGGGAGLSCLALTGDEGEHPVDLSFARKFAFLSRLQQGEVAQVG